MSEEKPQDISQNADKTTRRGRNSATRSREFCLCGHRASVHAAYRYACQAPGDRKGFCACMRFIARSSPIGKRLRVTERPKADTSSKPA